MSALELMGAPFAECLILVAIHTYLGLHVLKRRVIFVDLALAQIAALGTTVGFLFGIMPDTPGALLFSMAFTFVGAGVFSITRFRNEKVPQEAIIGLVYAISCALAVLVVEKTRGAEHLKDILIGNLLWVSWSDVALAAAVYAVVGAVHLVFRRKLWLISDSPERAYAAKVSVRAWDFLFYVTFGVVITLSVRVAGVLLVFVFLVAPAILAFMLTGRVLFQLLIGWAMGTAVTVGGLYASWTLDLPSGPAIITLYGVALSVAGILVFIAQSPRRGRALVASLGGIAAAVAVGGALWILGFSIGSTTLAKSSEAVEIAKIVSQEQGAVATHKSEQQNESTRHLLAATGGCADEGQVARYLALPGPEERLAQARQMLKDGKRVGLEFLLVALADEELPLLYREEGAELLRSATGQTLGYDSSQSSAGNAAAIKALCAYLRQEEATR